MTTRSLGDFEQLLLFAILRLEDNAYGVSIRREIEEQAGRSVSSGAVYTGLERLESKGYVTSRVGDTTPARGGRRRKYYHIEPEGAEALREAWDGLRAMARGVTDRLAALTGGGQ